MLAAQKKYEELGYGIIKIDFSKIPFKEIETVEEAVEIVKSIIMKQLREINFKSYDNIWRWA